MIDPSLQINLSNTTTGDRYSGRFFLTSSYDKAKENVSRESLDIGFRVLSNPEGQIRRR